MDALSEMESLVVRLIERTREGPGSSELGNIHRLLNNLKVELTAGRQERQQIQIENLKLKAQEKALRQQLAQIQSTGPVEARAQDELIEHLGALFVRKPGGRIDERPLCRQCRGPLRAVSAEVPFSCSRCQIFALFRPPELNDVLLTLRRS